MDRTEGLAVPSPSLVLVLLHVYHPASSSAQTWASSHCHSCNPLLLPYLHQARMVCIPLNCEPEAHPRDPSCRTSASLYHIQGPHIFVIEEEESRCLTSMLKYLDLKALLPIGQNWSCAPTEVKEEKGGSAHRCSQVVSM